MSLDLQKIHNFNMLRLYQWIEENGLTGYDPYDVLASPFLFGIERRAPFLSRLAIQAMRLSPVNLRSLFGVDPTLDAKALGLLCRAWFLLASDSGNVDYGQRAAVCLDVLESLAVPGFAGNCWAHPFPYRSSRSILPANFPTVVSTVYAAQAFLDGYERTGEERWLKTARSACDFILNDLPRIGDDDKFCFSYYPGVKLPVHNANLLAAALLARVAHLTGENTLLESVYPAVYYSVDDQCQDGSWKYDGPESAARNSTFIDGFHTGFVLESLWEIAHDAGMILEEPIRQGLSFYLKHLFELNGQPRRRNDRRWPVDLRDCAQAIIVLSRLQAVDPDIASMLEKTVFWTNRYMQAPEGYFYYLRWRGFITPIPYIRFQGWMMVALARYLQRETQEINRSGWNS